MTNDFFEGKSKEEILSFFFNKNVLVSPKFIEALTSKKIVLSKDFVDFILSKRVSVLDMKTYKALFEKNRVLFDDKKAQSFSVKVLVSYPENAGKKKFDDFVKHYNHRFVQLQNILRNHPELSHLKSIGRIVNSNDRSRVSIIAMVDNKTVSHKNTSISLTVEDPTGSIRVIVRKDKKDLFNLALNLPLDSVVGFTGSSNGKILFADSIVIPDIPQAPMKKAPDEAYAIFLSDLHYGSKKFLGDDFNRFLSWIRGKLGDNKQREVAKKTKYIFVIGDLVDGVGIYRGQDKDLAIPDIYEQYKGVAALLDKIPKDKAIIIIPGNHDADRLAEPQPPLPKKFAGPLYELKNAFLLSNPSYVNIHSSPGFSGFNALLYHGFSFDYFVANIPMISEAGGYDNPEAIMKFLLKMRHLAPEHGSSVFAPAYDKDPMVIDIVPDFFLSGHIHKTSISNYKNVTLVCGSCWQARTAFQERVGHHPEPSRVPIVNLKTRKFKILKFLSENKNASREVNHDYS